MGSYTTGTKLYKPALNELGWGEEVSENFDRLSEHVANVKSYGCVLDGVTDDHTNAQAAIDTGAAFIYIPAGTLFLGDGKSLTLRANQTIVGAGRRRSYISSKNAYALATPATGSVDEVFIRDLGFTLRSGSTSGGALKAVSNSYHSGWALERLEASGVSGCTDPVYWVDGFIGSFFDDCKANGSGGDGFYVASAGFVSNHVVISRSRAQSYNMDTTTRAGFHINGGSACRIVDSITESNYGYGIRLNGHTHGTVRDNWFESNRNHNLMIEGGTGNQVYGNKFHYNDGGLGTAKHIVITGSVNGRHFHRIEGNTFQDSSSSGVGIDIGSNVEYTTIRDNRIWAFASSAFLSDSGTRTVYEHNDTPYTALKEKPSFTKNVVQVGGTGMVSLKGDTMSGDNSDITQTGLFAIANYDATAFFGVARAGFPVFWNTIDASSVTNFLPTKGFTLYWDGANDRPLKCWYRVASGATGSATVPLPSFATTWTAQQTFSSVTTVSKDNGIEFNAGGSKIFGGSGAPENVKTAPVGSLYLRTDGGANTTLYVKESGTGNTGWVAK